MRSLLTKYGGRKAPLISSHTAVSDFPASQEWEAGEECVKWIRLISWKIGMQPREDGTEGLWCGQSLSLASPFSFHSVSKSQTRDIVGPFSEKIGGRSFGGQD